MTEEKKIVYLPIDQLYPHPKNPRKDLGDLTELADSIKTKGVLQNFTVVPGHWLTDDEIKELNDRYDENPNEELRCLINSKRSDYGYTVIIGHRRREASKIAGLTKVPCVITEMSEAEQAQTMLLENMQRTDLTVYEQAQGFQMMMEFGDTVEGISEKTGFSKTTIRRRLKMCELDQKKLKEVSYRQISLEDLDKLAQIEDIKLRNKVLNDIGTNNFNQSLKEAQKKEKIAKNLPNVKKWLKEHNAKKIERKETYGNKYTSSFGKNNSYFGWIYLESWGEKSGNRIPSEKDLKGIQLFYMLDDCHLSLYRENPRVKSTGGAKSDEEKSKSRTIREVCAKIRELTALHYSMRSDFIKGLTVNKSNKEKIIAGALYPALFFTHSHSLSHSENVTSILGIGSYEYKTDVILKALDQLQEKDLAKAVYAIYGDHAENWFVNTMMSPNTVPYYEKTHCNTLLQLLYRWLISLGYESSDDELAMMDGSHEIYHRIPK